MSSASQITFSGHTFSGYYRDLSADSPEGWDQLKKAIQSNQAAEVRRIVESRPGLLRHIESGISLQYGPSTALSFAARHGNAEMIRLLIAKGASVTFMPFDNGDSYPLHLAVQYSNIEAAEALIDAGADMEYVSNLYTNPQTLFSVAVAVFSYGSDRNIPGIAEKAFAIVTMMVRRGANLHSKDKSGLTPLQYALVSDDKQAGSMIDFIIEQGSDDASCVSDEGIALLRKEFIAEHMVQALPANIERAKEAFAKRLTVIQQECQPYLIWNVTRVVCGYLS